MTRPRILVVDIATAMMMEKVMAKQNAIDAPDIRQLTLLSQAAFEPCQPSSGDQYNDTPAYRQRHNRNTGVARAKRESKKRKRK